MHWLHSIDLALFHFINSTLSNSFFDWLMPVLSGANWPWLPVAVIGISAAVIFGSVRLRLCLLLMVVTTLGDPLIIETIKRLVQRARPCVSVADDIVRLNCGGYHSFPSAHAANWFAVAMIAFLFYRRKAWFVFLIAAGVAFSRVYCGVHFPTDVTVGAILGAGYAIALALGAEWLWNSLGRRVFPTWHGRLPSLLNPQPASLKFPPLSSESEWMRLSYLVVIIALVARWFYLRSGILELSGDEAYQWLWSKHLALSYYSKPFGIALLQWAGTAIGGDTEFGVRFFPPLISAVMSVMVLRFIARETGARTAFFLLLATQTTPLLAAGSVLMTIDPPLVLCWMWAVIAGWRAVQADGKTRDWAIVGLAIGLGFLCKYTAALQIVCWMIYFALRPAARVHLRKPGPWLALGVFALCTLPVLIWNSQHHWITVTHVAGNAQLDQKWQPTLKYFGEFFLSEWGLMNPIFFLAALWASVAFWKRREEKPLWLFLFSMGAPLFYGYWLFSLHSRVQPNWPAAAVPPLFCLMALFWHERPRMAKPLLIAGLGIGFIATALLYSTSLTRLFVAKLPGDVDPMHRTGGWRAAAAVIEKEHQKFGTNSFIIAPNYGETGLFTFYSPAARATINSDQPLIYCLQTPVPENQFYFWDEYNYRAHRRGENAIYVQQLDYYKLERGWVWKWLRHEPLQYRDIPSPPPPPPGITVAFETVTNLGVREIRLPDGRIVHRLQIFGCYHLK